MLKDLRELCAGWLNDGCKMYTRTIMSLLAYVNILWLQRYNYILTIVAVVNVVAVIVTDR